MLAFLALPVWAETRGDLVIGSIERRPNGLVVRYQNQGPGKINAKGVSLRILSSRGKELVTVDSQPVPREPGQICESNSIPFASLNMRPRDFYALFVEIDPRDQIAEAKKHNNSFFQQNNFGSIVEVPNFRRYAGRPHLVIDKVRFVAPDTIEATVLNRGKGITMASYGARLTIRGRSNNLDHYRHYQPIPRVGQVDRWVFKFERWGVHHGETIKLKFDVDADHWIADPDRRGQVLEQTMRLGPPISDQMSTSQASGTVVSRGQTWSARSCYACWIPGKSTLGISFFPFELTAQDKLGCTYNEPSRVCRDRARRQSRRPGFAQLNLVLEPGTKTLDKEKIIRAGWMVGDGAGRHSVGCDIKDLSFERVVLKEGAALTLRAATTDRGDSLKLAGKTVINLHPDVDLKDETEHHLPHDVPASKVKGVVRFRNKTFAPASAFAYYWPAYHRLDLTILARRILPEHMFDIRLGSWGHVVDLVPRGEIKYMIAYFDTNKPQAPQIDIGIAMLDTGYGGSISTGNPFHKLILKAPKFGDGQPLSFRLRAQSENQTGGGPAEIDLSGTAVMLEMK